MITRRTFGKAVGIGAAAVGLGAPTAAASQKLGPINLPQETPKAFVDAVLEVARLR